ncbi:MAG: C_GCAxxG_C_C family protein [Deltaproteobacteria bacterium]|nr:C_GCAxxG_C_C family protein [Deltaproteobacteria bacterium]MBW2266502.1 C_GCAxxG_C_C family protein [Deltaproteobacteria bacterium]MBW2601854.1 C_GCAxxG_C_C family protein [Deltaproteobacteria bacterium]
MNPKSMEYFHKEVKGAAGRGLLCSQIIVDVGLRYLGMRSECLIKSTAGLVGAMGLQDATCGALTGAASLIAFAAIDRLGQGIYLLIEDLESCFSELISKYPANTCGAILDYDPTKAPTQVCPSIIAGALQGALRILADSGISPLGDPISEDGEAEFGLGLEDEIEAVLKT